MVRRIERNFKDLLDQETQTALENDEFELYYQPQFNLRTGSIVGVESLIRWNHPLLGSILPHNFIPQAEDSGVINQLGHWVLEKACSQAKKWHNKGLDFKRVAVNLSSTQIRQSNFYRKIKEILKKFELEPELIEIEITENVLMELTNEVLDTLNNIKKMGVHITLDDFGTGYSSLSYLRHFPVDRIKIDRSFLKDLNVNSDNMIILKSIIQLIQDLNKRIIAEGVETQSQVEVLLDLECDEGQGYLLSKPLPAKEMEAILISLKESG